MAITKKVFDTDKNTGKTVYEYTLENKNGMKAQILTFGAIIRRLWVPGEDGTLQDVVLGHDTLEPYYKNPGYLGAAIGPNANRIGNASFVIDGITYHVEENEGKNNLHSNDTEGYHCRMFEAEESENSLRLYLTDTDGQMGFPGNRTFEVIYTLTDANELRMDYHATSDKNTVLNPTNHSYFNLAGQDAGSIEDHELKLYASNYTPTLPGSIPTGEIATVKGTPMDFTESKRIGKEIGEDFEQLKLAGGYDHNWVIDDFDGQLKLVAEVKDPKTSRIMRVFTNLPGIQFYAGNFLGEQQGKDGAAYHDRVGLALETQVFPDSINKENFPNAVFGPDRMYASTTVYQFC